MQRAYKIDHFEKIVLVKERFVKKYRNAVLDKKLSQRRVKSVNTLSFYNSIGSEMHGKVLKVWYLAHV